MTTKLNPDGPKLILDGEEQDGDKLSDSSWEGLSEGQEKKTQDNLGKIAKARKEKRGAARTEG